MDIISTIAPYFQHYIHISRVHPTATYNYLAREAIGLPVFETKLLLPKARDGESRTYIAVAGGANPTSLKPGERLYVGCETADRMFRGDGTSGTNFHHGNMRSGKGGDDPVKLLRAGGTIDIYCLDARSLAKRTGLTSALASIVRIMNTPGKHPGYWLEQLILHQEFEQWRWNKRGCEKMARLSIEKLL